MREKDLTILIPARAGSKRVPGKNLKVVGARTLLQRAIETALEVVGEGAVYVSSDSMEYVTLAKNFGALAPSLRPQEFSKDSSIDFEWLKYSIKTWNIATEYVCILRPTSPFLSPDSLVGAKQKLDLRQDFDSIRAMRRVSEHPGKMWRIVGDEAVPLLPQIMGTTPTHSRPTQSLETVYVQCGAFEIARTSSVLKSGKISGDRVLGYELGYPENLDVNTEQDLLLAGIEELSLKEKS